MATTLPQPPAPQTGAAPVLDGGGTIAHALARRGVDVLVLGKRRHGDAHTVWAAGGINASLGNLDPDDDAPRLVAVAERVVHADLDVLVRVQRRVRLAVLLGALAGSVMAAAETKTVSPSLAEAASRSPK